MGHAYLAATECDPAMVLAVMSRAEEVMQSLLMIHEEQRQTVAMNENGPSSAPLRKAQS